MKITVLTLFPETIHAYVNESILKRAQEKKLIEIEVVNLRDFAGDKYGTVDDTPYGGGAGMVMRVDVIHHALNSLNKQKAHTLLTSARGKTFTQSVARRLALLPHIVIICGHYEGIDERVNQYVDEEISLGDFVMTGGELTACAIIDAVSRLKEGVLSKGSAEEESFEEVPVQYLIQICGLDDTLETLRKKGVQSVALLEYPHFTRPEKYEDSQVPDVLMSGHHAKIHTWRIRQRYELTRSRRPDLLDK